jgi:DNA-directed RNA polymerase subunit N
MRLTISGCDSVIIPIRCMTCGKPIGHLWESYQAQVKKGANPKDVLDKLGLERYCCRSLFLTHKDMTERVGQFRR